MATQKLVILSAFSIPKRHERRPRSRKTLFWHAGSDPKTEDPGMTIAPDVRQQILRDNKRHEKDTGSPEVQIALLTAEIRDLTEHMKRHSKDYHSRHGLLLKVNRRNKLAAYLRRVDAAKYAQLAEKLGLRK